MDYLQSLWRRQEALLLRLLIGGGHREETGAEEEPRRARQAALPTEAGREEISRPGGQAWEMTAVRRPAERGEEETHRLRRREEAEMAGQMIYDAGLAELEAQAETFHQIRQADALWRPAVGEGLPEVARSFRESRGTGMDAAALSRAIQRDARRYDGGFTMY